MSNLAKRFATAGVLVPLILLAIYLDPSSYGILALAATVAVVANDEYLRMGVVRPGDAAWGLRLAAGLCAAAIAIGPTLWGIGESVPPLLMASVLTLSTVILARKTQLPEAGRHLAVVLSGLVYIPLLVSVLPLLKVDGRVEWLVVSLCLAFFSDTVAYFFGRFLGRAKLYLEVSPNKTRVGALGGLVGGVLATAGVGVGLLLPALPMLHALALGVVGSVAGQVGDLIASMTKRTFGVKDTGAILPGHGGMLDRIDGMLFVTPVVYWYVQLVGG